MSADYRGDVKAFGCRIMDYGFRTLEIGLCALGFGFRYGFRTWEIGRRALSFGFQILDFGLRSLDLRL